MAEEQKLKVAVLMGGPSFEHEVSLSTGRMILEALDSEKYNATPVLINREGEWSIPLEELQQHGTQVAFIALHGEYGEDGTVQSILKSAKLPYTGSDVLSSALGMNKYFSLRILQDAGVTVPVFLAFNKNQWEENRDALYDEVMRLIGLPFVVKPTDRGSSVGTVIARTDADILPAFDEAFRYSRHVIVQKFIKGREITCSVLHNDADGIQALPLIEIVPRMGEFYDYKSKYADGGSDHLIPAPFSDEETSAAQEIAKTVHILHGCYGMSRTDMIVGEDGAIYVLEINTIPGMTPTSLLPQAAQAAGISFPEVLDKLIHAALMRQ
ncbi:MAG: hypothetical protein A3F24_02520 [Candidatus Colwellbacteria bacterium RIFCSPHIGHO2_12_FULL_44_17]|uniref:D-alanine--D-alanine ligase n=2 Tax=Candidatus Colwelliibacteriota TaxID=1817904 RepID=A0A1G1Z851_9BACT|nr:MAG: hypothetical protein A3F24_02520 [Candidatus Colwellbacteria bacterium RIFCSPHIGHO2_12_FULL_44_17]OGY60808.1 MAG: hypothetical protein A3I31_02405 [Candidatus Colwellbacteria bacterium RIFCSPLOWO2_02_FULL_44_20b]